jgi:outer membrane receptor protein involved in Fe transport
MLAFTTLAGCAGSDNWTKPGADSAAAGQALQECQAVTATATKTDADIDQDIGASRGADYQRSDFVRTQSVQARDTTRDRAAAILAACMQAKGFKPAK